MPLTYPASSEIGNAFVAAIVTYSFNSANIYGKLEEVVVIEVMAEVAATC